MKRKRIPYICLFMSFLIMLLGCAKEKQTHETVTLATVLPTTDAILLGSANIAGDLTDHALHPCANSQAEAKQLLNQFISYNINRCFASSTCHDVNEVIPEDALDRNFAITETGNFYQVNKTGTDFDDYIQFDDNTDMIYTPDTLYICRSQFVDYLNTVYGLPYFEDYLYHPYHIEPTAITLDRQLVAGYLQQPDLGIARVADGVVLDEAFAVGFMNLMYELGYMVLSTEYSDEKIVGRDVIFADGNWVVEDTISRSTVSDMLPFISSRSYYTQSITINEQTRIVISNWYYPE